jgi:hypothetical protein
MSLWGNIDYVTSNLKPLYANTTNASSNSTINGTSANQVYGIVAGVSATETERANSLPQHPTHAGWVSLKVGTGPVKAISVSGGTGINAAGYLTFTSGDGTGANVSFTTANSQNTLQSYSTNPTLNTYGTFTVNDGGSGYTNAAAITVRTNGANIALGTFTVELGGRAGRIQTETLVAMGSITLDDPRDNVYFTGV